MVKGSQNVADPRKRKLSVLEQDQNYWIDFVGIDCGWFGRSLYLGGTNLGSRFAWRLNGSDGLQ